MSSSSNSDEDETVEHASGKSREESESKLETELKSLQVNETIQAAQSSPIEEVGKIPVRIPNFKDHFLPTFDQRLRGSGASQAETSKWRDLNIREKKESTPVAQSLGWRDPSYKYERGSSNKRLNEDSNRNRINYNNEERNWRRGNRSSSFEDTSVYHPRFDKNKRKMGNWSLVCASDIILDNGLTELEHVRNCVTELHEQNGELFATRPSEYATAEGVTKINCYTSNYEDKVQITKVADALIEKIGTYPYCFYYYYNNKPTYMRTHERELYEFTEYSWKLIEFEE